MGGDHSFAKLCTRPSKAGPTLHTTVYRKVGVVPPQFFLPLLRKVGRVSPQFFLTFPSQGRDKGISCCVSQMLAEMPGKCHCNYGSHFGVTSLRQFGSRRIFETPGLWEFRWKTYPFPLFRRMRTIHGVKMSLLRLQCSRRL